MTLIFKSLLFVGPEAAEGELEVPSGDPLVENSRFQWNP